MNIPDERRDQIKRVYHRAYDEASVTSGGGRRVLIEAGVLAVAEWARREALREAEAERDALQARLDAMTVEWGVQITVPNFQWVETKWMHDRASAERFVANQPLWYTHQVGEEFSIVQRTAAGPWTVVPEGDGNV